MEDVYHIFVIFYRRELEMSWVLYILECTDKSLYTGITNDLEAGFLRMKAGKAQNIQKAAGLLH